MAELCAAMQSHNNNHVLGQSSPLFSHSHSWNQRCWSMRTGSNPAGPAAINACTQCGHTHTCFSFQRTTHHLVVGTRRPPGRATAGPLFYDELFGLLFCHPGCHTLEVIGYELGPLASNPTFEHQSSTKRSWFTSTCLLQEVELV